MPWTGLPVGFGDIIGLMALGLASLVIPIFIATLIIRRRSMSRSDAMARLSAVIHSIAMMHSVSVFIGVFLLIVWWREAAWSHLGVVSVDPNWYWKSLLCLFLAYLMITAAIVAALHLLKFFARSTKKPNDKTGNNSASQLDDFSVAGLFAYAVLVPIAEEVVFRGVLYGWLRQDMSPTASTLISSIAFGLAHGISLNGIMTFFHGIGLAILYEKSGSILPGIVVHAVNNAIAITFLGMIRRHLSGGSTDPKKSPG